MSTFTPQRLALIGIVLVLCGIGLVMIASTTAIGTAAVRADGGITYAFLYKQAVAMLSERVRTAKPGEWVSVLGGWSEEQFTDEPRGFPLAELDKLAPDTPLAVQSTRLTLRRHLAGQVQEQTDREGAEQSWLSRTEDNKEGLRAVAERRPGKFQAR